MLTLEEMHAKRAEEKAEFDAMSAKLIEVAQTKNEIVPWFNHVWIETNNRFIKDGILHEHYTLSQDEIISTPFGSIQGSAGETVVRDGSGFVTIHEPGRFEQYFTDIGNGICVNNKFSVVYRVKLADHDGQLNAAYGATVNYVNGLHYIVSNDMGIGKFVARKFWVVDKNSFDLIYTPYPSTRY